MNRWEGRGGLTRDPDVEFLASGMCRYRITVAVNGTKYDAESRQQVVKTAYIAVTAFGWLAEQLAEHGLTRGDEVYVVGELDQYEQVKDDGKKERKTGVVALLVQPIRVRHGARAQTRQAEEPPPVDPWS